MIFILFFIYDYPIDIEMLTVSMVKICVIATKTETIISIRLSL